MTEDRSVFRRSWQVPTRTIAYGPHPDQVIDEWWSGTTNQTALVFFHGGFWDEEFDRTHCYPLATALAESGLRVLLPEYRRVRGAGGWPATLDDARDALTEAFARVGDEQVVVGGHSAGGQLALWVSATTDLTVSRVVALAPVADLATAFASGLGEGAVDGLLGGGPTDVPQRYASVDPVQAPTPSAPVSLIHGTKDTVVPLQQSQRYVEAHPHAALTQLNCGHFELIDPESTVFATVSSAVWMV